ncbi:glycine-rich protein [Gordonia soli]|uniref:receptor protein-tyrosine kinase n=1 Tax=Gordonia soli NBRC 108243 TaxID=1223545 RepID=M0QLN4_9ACTN|nr:glycine-rich protein [Gordonia soli]GAC69575.1 hypothetical protein GS4_26_00220 [Gordonia soli NBRC 108243]
MVTCTYTAAGPHTLVLPAGVRAVQVTAIGGHGGTVENRGVGGQGAVVTGTVAVPAQSRTLTAVVAGNGADTTYSSDPGGVGGVGGGGRGGTPNMPGSHFPGAGGGGGSDIRTVADDLDSRVLVAGGGGGGGYVFAGGEAGAPGNAQSSGTPAQAGTSNAGGAGGTYPNIPAFTGSPGTLGVGGSAALNQTESPLETSQGGGGGGGGLYGGGGGSIAGGGAGGSSLVPAGGTLGVTEVHTQRGRSPPLGQRPTTRKPVGKRRPGQGR